MKNKNNLLVTYILYSLIGLLVAALLFFGLKKLSKKVVPESESTAVTEALEEKEEKLNVFLEKLEDPEYGVKLDEEIVSKGFVSIFIDPQKDEWLIVEQAVLDEKDKNKTMPEAEVFWENEEFERLVHTYEKKGVQLYFLGESKEKGQDLEAFSLAENLPVLGLHFVLETDENPTGLPTEFPLN